MRRFRRRCRSNICKKSREVMASNFAAHRVTNRPSATETAPNTPRLSRVGAWRRMGSTSSGGTHMVQLDPCCWKWHSSPNQRSRSSLRARRRGFFRCPLLFGIGLGDQGPGLAPPEAELTEQALTLPDPQAKAVRLAQMVAEELAIPEVLAVPQVAGPAPKVPRDASSRGRVHPGRTPPPRSFLQAGEAALLETAHPVLDAARAVSQDPGRFMATEPPRHQQHAVQAVVIAGFLRPHNLLLQRDPHQVRIGNFQSAHGRLLPAHSIAESGNMRK